MEFAIVSKDGVETGRKLSCEILGQGESNSGILHEVIRWQRAKKRAGSHSVKTRSEVRGGGRKLYKQKGTGHSRAGSRSSPMRIGGGVAHGPKVRSYEFNINRKERKRALKDVVSMRGKEGALKIIDSFDFDLPKTRCGVEVLENLGFEGMDKVLIVTKGKDDIVEKSFRNIPGVSVLPVEGLNVYDIMLHSGLLFQEESFNAFVRRLSGNEGLKCQA